MARIATPIRRLVLLLVVVVLYLLSSSHVSHAAYRTLGTYRSFIYDISDDNTYAVYYSDYGELDSVNLDTGQRLSLVTNAVSGGGLVQLSPDGNTVYFSDSGVLKRVPTIGGAVMTMGTTEGFFFNERGAVTTPDGRYMAVVEHQGNGIDRLLVIDTATQQLRALSSSDYGMPIDKVLSTPNSQYFVHTYFTDASQARLVAAPVAGGGNIVLSPPGNITIHDFILSPDGAYVYFWLYQNDNPTNRMVVYRTSVTGGTPEPVSLPFWFGSQLHISPDGQYLFFFAQPTESEPTNILYRLNTGTLAVTPVFTTDHPLTVSGIMEVAAENRIVLADRPGTQQHNIPVYSIDYVTLGAPVLLTPHFGDHSAADNGTTMWQLTSDKRTLLFPEPYGAWYYVNRVPVDGSTPEQRVVESPIVRRFGVSAEDDGIFYISAEGARPYMRALRYVSFTPSAEPLTLFTPLSAIEDMWLQKVLPDHHVLYVVSKMTNEPVWEVMQSDLVPIVRFTTENASLVTEGQVRPITVELLPASTEPLSFTYKIIGGTATEGEDFTLSPATLVFTPGQSTQALTITAVSDAIDEPIEEVQLQLLGATVATPTTITVPIGDDVLPLSRTRIALSQETPDASIAVTRDGRTVVFAERTETGAALIARDGVTGDYTTLHPADGTVRGGAPLFFTPDEQSLFYHTTTGLSRVAITGGTSTPIALLPQDCTVDMHFATHHPAALLRVACTTSLDQLLQVDLSTNSTVSLVSPQTGQQVPFATFTGYDEILYALRPVGEDDDIPPSTLYQRPWTGGAASSRGTIPWDGDFISLLPDNDGLLFSHEIVLGVEINRLSLASGNTQTLVPVTFSGGFQITPRRDRIVALRIVGDCTPHCYTTTQLSSVRTDNGATTVLVEDTLYSSSLDLSDDGRRVVYGPARDGSLGVVPIDGQGGTIRFDGISLDAAFRAATNLLYIGQGSPADLTNLSLDDNTNVRSLFRDGRGYTFLHTQNDLLFFADGQGYLYVASNMSPAVAFPEPVSLHAEGETVTVTVSLGATPLAPVTVDYALTGGTATEGDDFTFTPGTLTFAPFERTKTFTVEVLDDGVAEPPETAVFALSNITGGSVSEQTTFTLTITDEMYQQWLPVLQR